MSYTQIQKKLTDAHIEHTADEDVLKEYSVDESVFEIKPQLVIFPRNTREVQKIVSIVHSSDEKVSLTPRAAGTGLSGGPLNDSIVVDVMKYLTGISSMELQDDGSAQIQVQPGELFRTLDAKTRKKGFFLPPYPSSRDICTVGGMVGNNAAGPNSLKYGHTAEFVKALKVVLADGNEYTLQPITYTQLQEELEREDFLGEVYRETWKLIQENYQHIKTARPKSSKNSAGYLLWEVLKAESLSSFIEGEGYFDLSILFSGSQGTIGIITEITFSLLPLPIQSDLVVTPISKLKDLSTAIQSTLTYAPYNVEIFDARTYKLALQHLHFFRKRFYADSVSGWILFSLRFLLNHLLYFKSKVPQFVLLVKFDAATLEQTNEKIESMCFDLEGKSIQARRVSSTGMEDMFWKVRMASYSLAKLGAKNKRPAAFLEDMVVPPQNLEEFLTAMTQLLKEYDAEYAIHGHGGNGHLHFYPLMDFTNPETPQKIKNMADDFFALAKKHGGNICGEHNDGIIRTPYLSMIFDPETITIFEKLEKIFDPKDIFNPGKKVNPKFDIVKSIRKRN